MSKSVLDWMLEQKKIPTPTNQIERDHHEDILIYLLRNLDYIDQKVG